MPLSDLDVHPLGNTTRRGRRYVAAALIKQEWINPAAADPDAFIETPVAGPDTTTDTYVPGDAAWDGVIPTGVMDFHRNVVITVTHATSVVALSGVITGRNKYGREITEAWSVTATGTSKVFTGAVAFERVISVTVVAAADASADEVVIGTGKVFGLDLRSAVASLVKEVAAGSVATNGVAVARSAAANADRRGTYTPNGTPDGIIDWQVWYISDDPHLSDED